MSVLAAKEEQRFPALNLGVFDFSDDNGVIPGQVCSHDAAPYLHDRVFENGHAFGRPTIPQGQPMLGFRVLLTLREVL